MTSEQTKVQGDLQDAPEALQPNELDLLVEGVRNALGRGGQMPMGYDASAEGFNPKKK